MLGAARLLAESKLLVFQIQRWRRISLSKKHPSGRLKSNILGWKGEKLTLPLGSTADPSSPPQSEMFLMPKSHKIWLKSVELMSMSRMVKVSMISVPTLASLLQPPVKSVIGAAFVTQTRRVEEEEEEEGMVRLVEVYQRYREKQKGELRRNGSVQVCVRFHAGALRSATAPALTCGRAFLRDHKSSPHNTHTHPKSPK